MAVNEPEALRGDRGRSLTGVPSGREYNVGAWNKKCLNSQSRGKSLTLRAGRVPLEDGITVMRREIYGYSCETMAGQRNRSHRR